MAFHRSPTVRALAACLSFTHLLMITAGPVAAQSRPTTDPATRPAPTKVTTPPGYVRIEAAGRSFITLPVDQAWVRSAASEIGRPTAATQPSDMLDNLKQRRDLVLAAANKDVPRLARSQIEQLLDGKVIPAWQELRTVAPAMVYVVSPAEHLKQALQAGWSDPRLRYNATANGIEFDRSVSLQANGLSDESAVAALFNPGDAERKRVSALARFVANSETQIQAQISGRAVVGALVAIAELIDRDGFKELPRGEDQDWLATGLSHVLAAKYVSMIHGAPVRDLLQAVVAAPPDAVFNAPRIDLISPLAKDQLKPELVDGYLEAKQRKAIAVMYGWWDKAGDEKIAPLVEGVGRLRPADGLSLVAAVKSISDIDLTERLRPE